MTLPNPHAEQRAREVLAKHVRPLNRGASWNILEGKDDGYWLPVVNAMLEFALIDHLKAAGGAEAMKERAATFAFEQCDDERGDVWNAACAHVANAFRYEANPFGQVRALPAASVATGEGDDARA